MTFLLNSLSALFSWVSLSAARRVGRALGAVWGLCSSRKKEVLERMCRSLGVEDTEAKRIYASMYRNLGMTMAECFRLPRMSEAELREQVVFKGLEHSPPSGTAFIALVSHTGNWEWLAASTTLMTGHPTHVVVKALRPESLNNWLLSSRSRWGTRFLDRRGSARELLKVLRGGEALAFILDQNMKRDSGVFVDFFGEPACTSDGLSQLAAMTGVETYPVFCRRLPDHTLEVVIEPPIAPPERNPEGIREHTQLCTRRIEDFVRAHPDQWIWMHRRWRTQAKISPERAHPRIGTCRQ